MKRQIACGAAAALLLLGVAGCGTTPAESGKKPDATGLTSGATAAYATDSTSEEGVFGTGTSGGSLDAPTASGSTSKPQSGGKKTNGKGQSATKLAATTAKTSSGGTATSTYYVNSKGKVFQNMNFTYKDVKKAYTVNGAYQIQDLGQMQLESYPIDGVYDSCYNILYIDGVYKMWWVRACPFDTVWYAESKDLKNWYNEQMCIDLYKVETPYVKQMLAWPTVLYVNGKYHMYFEAPAEIAASGEYSNNIFYASSKDGINWTMYPNNKNPQPVIKNPNIKEGIYGVGQPKAFYKDGKFYVCYTDASNSGGNMRLATSANGYSFSGTVSEHPLLISDVAGAALRYSTKMNKWYLMFTKTATKNGVYNDDIYVLESDSPTKWGYASGEDVVKKITPLSQSNDVRKKGNVDLVTDQYGIVQTETLYMGYMDGLMPAKDEDHRNTHTTWDGHFLAINTGKYVKQTITLPNGKANSAANLKWYADKVGTWKSPQATAAYGTAAIDGSKDAGYAKSSPARVESVIYNWDYCKPTGNVAEVSFQWNEEFLYLFADVTDTSGIYTDVKMETPGHVWMKDGLDIFIDVPNSMTGTTNNVPLTPMSYMFCASADNQFVVKDNRQTLITNEFSGAKVAVKKTAKGYAMEAAIPWYSLVKDQIKAGKAIGLDIGLNENKGTGTRSSIVAWSDYTGNAFQYLDRFGTVTLKK